MDFTLKMEMKLVMKLNKKDRLREHKLLKVDKFQIHAKSTTLVASLIMDT